MNKRRIELVLQVNPHDFYSACKKSRAVKEAFRFSQLAKKSLRNYNMLLSVCAQARDASGRDSCSRIRAHHEPCLEFQYLHMPLVRVVSDSHSGQIVVVGLIK